MRLDCCNLVVCWSDGLDPLVQGKKQKVWWAKICSGSVVMPRYLPWVWGAFSPQVEGLRNETEGTLRVFVGFWHLLRHDSSFFMDVGEKHRKITHISEELSIQAGDVHVMIQKPCENHVGHWLFPLGPGKGTNLRGKLPSHWTTTLWSSQGECVHVAYNGSTQ